MNTKQLMYGGIIVVVLLGLAFVLANANEGSLPDRERDASGEVLSGTGEYAVVADESEVLWEADKTLVASYTDRGVVGVQGGSVSVADGVVTRAEVVFDMNTIEARETGSGEGRDMLTGHLKSDDFFGVATHPTATLVVESVGEADAEGVREVAGTLTMKGVTNPVTFPAEIYMRDGDVHIFADFSLDRTLWNVQFGSGKFFQDLGDNVISDEFRVSAHIVARADVEVATSTATTTPTSTPQTR